MCHDARSEDFPNKNKFSQVFIATQFINSIPFARWTFLLDRRNRWDCINKIITHFMTMLSANLRNNFLQLKLHKVRNYRRLHVSSDHAITNLFKQKKVIYSHMCMCFKIYYYKHEHPLSSWALRKRGEWKSSKKIVDLRLSSPSGNNF